MIWFKQIPLILHRLHTLPTHLIDTVLDQYTSQIGAVDLALLKLISGEKWQVSRLVLQNINIDTAVIRMLVALKGNLVSVNFTKCVIEKSVDLTELGSFLLELEFNECDGFTIKELKSLGSGAFIRMVRLRLSVLSPITGKILKFIMPSLKTFELNRVTIPLIKILNDISGSLHRLTLVQINGAINMLDTSTLILPNVETLDVQNVELSIKFLASLRSWFPSLKRLTVSTIKRVGLFETDDDDPLLTLAFDTVRKSGISVKFLC